MCGDLQFLLTPLPRSDVGGGWLFLPLAALAGWLAG
jgi:hypothetical protein